MKIITKAAACALLITKMPLMACAQETSFPAGHTDEDHWICGFEIMECPDKGRSLELAAEHPVVRLGLGKVEVRPTFEPFEPRSA
ncbi:MAG: hypothetical protein CMK09_10330 [Ponticaulis sp.]|nr:hypothetical protein [Ponticaulis sp.]|tara:strand:- start:12736 stop:12990 length:255 start_codon:yes stop_codon:yes gene_type:complete